MMGFENFGRVEADPTLRMECAVCWSVYDPAEGDPLGRAPPGTPFADLPPDWRCPTCDAPASQFLAVADA